MNTPNVIFLSVKDNASKIARICETVHHHFELKEHLLILVPSEEAAKYIDQLLWRFPEESFLPHSYTNKASKDLVTITTQLKNLNESSILFNLCPEVSLISQEFKKIYDLFDETHPQKLQLSQQRESIYHTRGYHVHRS